VLAAGSGRVTSAGLGVALGDGVALADGVALGAGVALGEGDGVGVGVAVAGATVPVIDAGGSSTLPAASVERTAMVWAPEASPATSKGERQGAQPPSSSRHSVVVALMSSAEKRTTSSGCHAGSELARLSEVRGEVESSRQLAVDGECSVTPSEVTARTERTWEPSGSAGAVHGDVQALQSPPSTAHSLLASGVSVTNSARAGSRESSAGGVVMWL
jgi:hypothetical protein